MYKDFYSINDYFDNYKSRALSNKGKVVNFAFVRGEEKVYLYNTIIDVSLEDTPTFVEKLVKSLLYMVGCKKVIVDDSYLVTLLQSMFSPQGKRKFDYDFFTRVYDTPLQFEYLQDLPKACWYTESLGGKEKGKRIGFDAGGSDIKICAVKDGKALFSEEIVWLPKLNDNPDYHYSYIKDAIYKAYNVLQGADSLGVSTAGVVDNNELKIASLFIKVPRDLFEAKAKNIYKNIAKELNISLKVANDGDVAAYKGALELDTNCLMGIAMGTSEAVGYVDNKRRINGWLNELAFVPINVSDDAVQDEWSEDYGCGAKYLSQDAVIRLASQNGIALSDTLTLAEKLKKVQNYAEDGDKTALKVFDTVGHYLGEAVKFYSKFYDIKTVLLLGRVTSGKGGERILLTAAKSLENLDRKIDLIIPDEHTRRLGQAYAAAML